MVEVRDGVELHEVVIPVVCLAICVAFQLWEVNAPKDKNTRARSLFKSVRVGWVADNYMKGTVACNTTRDYIKSAVFFANTAITLATFTVGYAGTWYTGCADDNDCTAEDWLFIIKLAVLAAILLSIFFVFTQCTRFAVHFSFCINTRELDGVPLPHSLLVNVFEHAHRYYTIGMRLYFGTIPVFGWIFTPWALVGVTPVYLFMVRGLEHIDAVRGDMEQMARPRTALPAPDEQAATAPPGDEEKGDAKRL